MNSLVECRTRRGWPPGEIVSGLALPVMVLARRLLDARGPTGFGVVGPLFRGLVVLAVGDVSRARPAVRG